MELKFKKCNHCGLSKPETEFHRASNPHKACKLGLQSRCKKCQRELHREWYKKNPQTACRLARRYRRNNLQACKARNRAYYAVNRKRLCERQKKYIAIAKDAAYEAYGGYVCRCCGEQERAFLSLDHIHNNGAAHRRETTGKNSGAGILYLWLRKNGYPPGFQVLCMNCNWGKRMNGGVCPHQARTLRAVS